MRTLKRGRIVFDNFSRSFDCQVKNTSETGALLQIPNTTLVPDEFILYEDTNRTRRPVKVAWRGETKLGVQFTGPAEPIAKAPR